MHEHGLAKELWPQLQELARQRGFQSVTQVDMIVGSLHGVSADFLAHSFEHAFEGTNFEGAKVDIRIVDPLDEFTPPGETESVTAIGWELMITKMEGSQG